MTKDTIIKLAIFVAVIAVAIFASSCKEIKYIEKTTYQHDTLYQNKIVVDSTFLHDSIFIRSIGDTIFKDKIVLKEHWRTQIDTFVKNVEIHDTTTIESEKKVTEYKEPTFWQRLTYGFETLFWMIVILLVCWMVWKFVIKRFI